LLAAAYNVTATNNFLMTSNVGISIASYQKHCYASHPLRAMFHSTSNNVSIKMIYNIAQKNMLLLPFTPLTLMLNLAALLPSTVPTHKTTFIKINDEM